MAVVQTCRFAGLKLEIIAFTDSLKLSESVETFLFNIGCQDRVAGVAYISL